MLALVLVERLINDRTVLDLNVGLRRVAQPGERVLHPVLVVTVGVVLTGVGTTRLLASRSSRDGLNGALEEVTEFEGLNEVAVNIAFSVRSRGYPYGKSID